MHQIKDQLQRRGLNRWVKAGFKGTLEYATGIGKTRCGVLAIEYVFKIIKEPKVLILAPTEVIRDSVWLKEFHKWGMFDLYNKVQLECIQTAYKWEQQHFDLVICDELTEYLVPNDKFFEKDYEYFKFFENNTYDKLLGLTAKVEDKYSVTCKLIAPIVDSVPLPIALQMGLVAPHKIYKIGLSFTEDEQVFYETSDKIFLRLFNLFLDDVGIVSLKRLQMCLLDYRYFKHYFESDYPVIIDNMIDKPSITFLNYSFSDVRSYAKVANEHMSKRKNLLYSAENKLKAAKELIDNFPDKQVLIFAETIDMCDKLQKLIGDKSIVYHSGITKTQRPKNLVKFIDKEKNVLISAKALNLGLDISSVDMVIIVAGTSSPQDFIQRIGRGVRLEGDKNTLVVRLYIKGSQEERWIRASKDTFTLIECESVSKLKELWI